MKRMNAYDEMRPLFRPDSIAVVGASEKPGPGLQVLRNLTQLGYEGRIYPVNPKYEKICGLTCYPSLAAVAGSGHSVDLVAILLGRETVVSIVEEAARIGARAAWAFASGFGESDETGRMLNERLRGICKREGIHFLGPNCVGFLNPSASVGAYSAPVPRTVKRGHIGLVAQSGYLCLAMANGAYRQGFSLIASTGNETVVDSTDCMAYMVDDPETDVIIAFIEQFRSPEKLRDVATRAKDAGKPIVLLKVGRSEIARRATCAHTGALAGPDAVQQALFKKLGILQVSDLDELLVTAELLAAWKGRLPRGKNVFAITLSGGVISLLADVNESVGIRFPEWSEGGSERIRGILSHFGQAANPLDAWGAGRIADTYSACVEAMGEEEEADAILIVQDAPPGMAREQAEQYAIVARAAADEAKRKKKPVAMLTNTSTGVHPDILKILDEADVPVLQGTSVGLKAIAHAAEFTLSGGIYTKKCVSNGIVDQLRDAERRALTEYDSKRVLASYGVPCAREVMCGSLEACREAAWRIGYPVVLKVMSPDILHKTEAGVIGLNIQSESELENSYFALLENAKRFRPSGRIDGVLVQRMAEKPVAEVIAGIVRDPQFGPAVAFGSGGILVEVLKDSVLLIPPFSKEQAMEAIRTTKAYQLLCGFRGRPKGDVSALAGTLVAVGDMAVAEAHSICALDINPLMVYPEGSGVLAVDALLELTEK